MKIRFNVTGAQRKALVKAVAEILGEDFRYLGVPTFAYAFDYFTIDREGTLIFDDRTDEAKIGDLVSGLAERGFEASVTAAPSQPRHSRKPRKISRPPSLSPRQRAANPAWRRTIPSG